MGKLPTNEKKLPHCFVGSAVDKGVQKSPKPRRLLLCGPCTIFRQWRPFRFCVASSVLWRNNRTVLLNFDDNALPAQTVSRIIKIERTIMATAKKKVAPKAPVNPKTTAPAKTAKPAAKAAKPAAKATAKKAPVVSKTAKALAKISAGIAKLTERKDKISAEIAALRDQRAALKTAAAPVAAKAEAAPKAAAKAPAKKAKAPAKK